MRPLLFTVMVSALAACGKHDEMTTPDAADPIDGASPDTGPPPPVNVEVTHGGTPVTAVPVLVHDTSGAFVAQAVTDDAGKASVDVPAGGMVSVVYTAPDDDIYPATIVGVLPGETLRFAVPPEDKTPTIVGNLTLSIPSFTGPAVHFMTHTGAGVSASGVSSSLSIPLYVRDPEVAGDLTLLSLLRDTNLNTLAWSILPGVSKSATAVTLPAWDTTLANVTFSLTNAPADTSGAFVDASLLVDDVWRGVGHSSVEASAGDIQITTPIPATEHAIEIYAGLIVEAVGAVERRLYFHQVRGASQGTIMTDLATAPLPLVTSMALDVAASAGPTLSWSFDTTVPNVDAILIDVTRHRGSRMVDWYIIMPPDHAGAFTLPTLPEALAEIMPVESDDIYSAVMLIDVDEISSPAAYRADGLMWSRLIYDEVTPDAPPFGSRFTYASTSTP
ncbi:MAG: hypothetical protein SFX73_01905 [Kofleriaceae bacterium]|nr:hypothetical protein [Kofleriaceae bacterium]